MLERKCLEVADARSPEQTEPLALVARHAIETFRYGLIRDSLHSMLKQRYSQVFINDWDSNWLVGTEVFHEINVLMIRAMRDSETDTFVCASQDIGGGQIDQFCDPLEHILYHDPANAVEVGIVNHIYMCVLQTSTREMVAFIHTCGPRCTATTTLTDISQAREEICPYSRIRSTGLGSHVSNTAGNAMSGSRGMLAPPRKRNFVSDDDIQAIKFISEVVESALFSPIVLEMIEARDRAAYESATVSACHLITTRQKPVTFADIEDEYVCKYGNQRTLRLHYLVPIRDAQIRMIVDAISHEMSQYIAYINPEAVAGTPGVHNSRIYILSVLSNITFERQGVSHFPTTNHYISSALLSVDALSLATGHPREAITRTRNQIRGQQTKVGQNGRFGRSSASSSSYGSNGWSENRTPLFGSRGRR